MIQAAWNTYMKLPLPWVRTLGPDYWATRKMGDAHGPEKYQKLQPESYDLLGAIMRTAVKTDRILDLGCGPGRHMRALQKRGYQKVDGLDVAETFEAGLPALANWTYDLVFSFGTTIELIPPSFPICHHIARIARKAVVLMIHERYVPYPRLWKQEFEREHFTLTTYTPPEDKHGLTLFIFERLR